MAMYATVHMLIINEEKYIDGACISVYTYRKFGNSSVKHVIMIDDKISKKGIEKLSKFFDEIYEIKLIYAPSDFELSSEKRVERYGKWIDYSITKWNCLKLKKFKKILFCDIDTLAFQNYTNLFTLEAPAWCLFHKSALKEERMNKTFESMKTGDQLELDKYTQDDVCSGDFKDFLLVNASIVLLKPSLVDFSSIMKLLEKKIKAYGYYKLLSNSEHPSGPDEQILFEYFLCHKKSKVTVIGPEFLVDKHKFNKKRSPFASVTTPIIVNYDTTEKPWLKEEKDLYKDEKIWAQLKKQLKL